MLDWLKTILGVNYTEDIDKQVSAEIGKGFIAREDFNTLNEAKKQLETQVKERDKQLSELQKSAGANEDLQEQLKTLQADNKKMQDDHATQLKQFRVDGAVERALLEAKAKNVTAAKALLGNFLTTAELDDQGNVKGLTEAVKGLATDKSTAFMFDDGKLQLKGAKSGESEDSDQVEETDTAVSFAKGIAQGVQTAGGTESHYFK